MESAMAILQLPNPSDERFRLKCETVHELLAAQALRLKVTDDEFLEFIPDSLKCAVFLQKALQSAAIEIEKERKLTSNLWFVVGVEKLLTGQLTVF
jgi:hypothetical protein